jgi:dipeptidyl-peptidase-4
MNLNIFKTLLFVCLFSFNFHGEAQIKWTDVGDSYFKLEKNQLVTYTLPNQEVKTIVSKKQLTPKGKSEPIEIAKYAFSLDQQKILVFTNTKKVWNYNTKGDYWIFNFKTNTLTQIGKSLPASSLMFAKFSPDGNTIAYVHENNLYSENYESGKISPLTTNGTGSLINGTFDWAYEE